MKEIKINIPEGYEIDKQLSTFEKIVFKKSDNRFPNSWEDLNNLHGYFISDISEVCSYAGASNINLNGINELKNIYPTKELAEAALALCQLLQLRNHVWGDWRPDWCENEYKFQITFIKDEIILHSYCNINRVLSFETEEDAITFAQKYKNLIKIAKPLI